MIKNARTIATLVASGALLAAPAAGLAAKGGHGSAKANGKAKNCAKAPAVGYHIGGTITGITADDTATPTNEAAIVMTVTSANSHARKSGELADQDAAKKGVQVKGATVTIALAGTDAFVLKLAGYEGTDTPSVGDRVKVSGKIKLTKKRCAPAGTSTADRYATPDIKKVTISDRDPDA